jgi:hypothetical protein
LDQVLSKFLWLQANSSNISYQIFSKTENPYWAIINLLNRSHSIMLERETKGACYEETGEHHLIDWNDDDFDSAWYNSGAG